MLSLQQESISDSLFIDKIEQFKIIQNIQPGQKIKLCRIIEDLNLLLIICNQHCQLTIFSLPKCEKVLEKDLTNKFTQKLILDMDINYNHKFMILSQASCNHNQLTYQVQAFQFVQNHSNLDLKEYYNFEGIHSSKLKSQFLKNKHLFNYFLSISFLDQLLSISNVEKRQCLQKIIMSQQLVHIAVQNIGEYLVINGSLQKKIEVYKVSLTRNNNFLHHVFNLSNKKETEELIQNLQFNRTDEFLIAGYSSGNYLFKVWHFQSKNIIYQMSSQHINSPLYNFDNYAYFLCNNSNIIVTGNFKQLISFYKFKYDQCNKKIEVEEINQFLNNTGQICSINFYKNFVIIGGSSLHSCIIIYELMYKN